MPGRAKRSYGSTSRCHTPRVARRDFAIDPAPVGGFPETPERGRQPNNLPLRLGGLVGREREIAEVGRLLAYPLPTATATATGICARRR
jgi:hypothetical protein